MRVRRLARDLRQLILVVAKVTVVAVGRQFQHQGLAEQAAKEP
ncbi:hypothetical protein [Desulfitobacterium metallireducens]|nr:hypothetical protein [Desulfitobacterium metallireducens]